MQNRRARKTTTSLRLSPSLLDEVDRLVARTRMRSRTEFIERAVEAYAEEVREAKVIVVKPWSLKKAKSAILDYLKGHPGTYVSDIAEALQMDLDVAFRAVDALAREGKIE